MIIKGENCTLYVNGEYVTCWRSVQFSVDVETVGKSTIGSGNNREYEAVSIGWTGSGEGQVHNDAGVFTVHNLFDLLTSLTTVFLLWEVDGAPGNIQYYYGEAIIINLTQVYSVNNIASFNAEFQGTGGISRVDESDSIIYGNYPENFEITGTTPDTPGAGETTIDFAWDAADPEPDAYRIEVHNITLGLITWEDGGVPGNTKAVIVTSAHSYTFRIRSAYFSYSYFSEWSSPLINWP